MENTLEVGSGRSWIVVMMRLVGSKEESVAL